MDGEAPGLTGGASIATASSHFEYLPAGLFGSAMGLTGLSIAWRIVEQRYGTPAWIADLIAAGAAVDFVLMALGYCIKLVTAPDSVRTEFAHPIAVNTFATFWVSLLLLPIVLAPFSLLLARVMWGLGALGMSVFALYIVSRWLGARHQLAQVTPAWILPVVGLLDLPLAVPFIALPHAQHVMVAGLAVGMFFALPLFTLIFSRLIFEAPMPPALEPSLLILVAPFAVGMSTYVATTGQVDLFAESLYVLTLFILAVVLHRVRRLAVCCPFRVAWWAVSFPLAASAIASLRFAAARPGWATDAIALVLVALATVVILWLLGRTVLGVLRGELRTLSA